MTDKRPFLAVYDYGMGGIWMVFDARSAAEITEKYPMLIAFEDRPDWMTDEQYAQYPGDRRYDVDDPPTGWLLSVVREQQPTTSHQPGDGSTEVFAAPIPRPSALSVFGTIAILCGLLLYAYLLLRPSGAGCISNVLSEASSPDRTWTASIVEYVCNDGAFTTVVIDRAFLQRSGDEPAETKLLLIAETADYGYLTEVSWPTERTLRIVMNGSPRVSPPQRKGDLRIEVVVRRTAPEPVAPGSR